ncbi:MAG: quinolinate synthase NadA [Candidatus Hydrothermarchaeaceae archaeon]
MEDKDFILEQKKDCIILAHNYQIPKIQEIADFVGDSLDLCQTASRVEKPYIIFCGVDFMAESAVMLNPEKTVLMPTYKARCPMATMLPAEKVREAKREHPDAAVVLYINTHAEARAESDVTCTSANAIEIVKALDEKKILFGPDVNLAGYVSKNLPDKEIIPIPKGGHCRVHVMFKREHILKEKERRPDAEVLIHPECLPEVQELADHICSTGQMVKRSKKSKSKEFIIATETGLLYRLRKENPDKKFYPALDKAVCRNMKMITLENLFEELKERKNIVKVKSQIAEKARASLERMLELSKGKGKR